MNSPAPLSYCLDLLHYHRRPTREVHVGNVVVGGNQPIRVQSMITADTRDTAACVAEVLTLADAGCEIVRITAQTRAYAENLEHIARGVRAAGCHVPLVADIHFKPDAALEAAKWVEKVRINPGNYVDKKKFEVREYSDAQYDEELERIREESPCMQSSGLPFVWQSMVKAAGFLKSSTRESSHSEAVSWVKSR